MAAAVRLGWSEALSTVLPTKVEVYTAAAWMAPKRAWMTTATPSAAAWVAAMEEPWKMSEAAHAVL